MLSRLTLRMRLTVLYGALFSASIVAVVACAEVLWPNLLRAHSSQQAPPGTPGTPGTPGSPGSPAGPALAGSAGLGTHSLSVESAVFVLAVIAGSLLLGWVIAGRNLRPLQAIIATSRDISARNLHERLALTGPRDEFTELGETLDELFGRLEASFESQRRFVANASHELRTPLAAERTLLQVTLADPAASVANLRAACEEVLVLGDQQERLISALLTLASGEGGVERWEPIDLAEITGLVLAGRGRDGVAVDAMLGAAPTVGDARLVESLVANLVDNALRYNVPGGRVTVSTGSVSTGSVSTGSVSTGSVSTGGRAVLSVANTGPLVAASDVDRLFQPFQRLDGERVRHDGGYGLGLAIVRAIAGAHHAELTATARAEGGLSVEVSFNQLPSA
jgi:signal transduction histidine kinase